MKVDGDFTNDLKTIEKHIIDFYQNLFGVEGDTYVTLAADFWKDGLKLHEDDAMQLIKPFSEFEIEEALFSSSGDKAPGPDGIGFAFYQKFWPVVKHDILNLFADFFNHQLDVAKLNRAMICLVPKKINADDIKHYRPISLINCIYKLITKVLTNRIEPVANKIIDHSQAAFLKGRLILDNVVCAAEIIHETKIKSNEGMVFKIDMEKAYDRVHWGFLLNMMHKRGFPQKWILWISSILKGGHTCINLNGTLSSYFEVKRGLKQGDPLSPILFNLVADTLNHIIKKARCAGFITGLGPNIDEGYKITNLHYADDTIIFCNADAGDVQALKWAFIGFEALSGMKINFSKCEALHINIDLEKAALLANLFGCPLGNWPLTYLGIPIHWKKPKSSDWQYIIDRCHKKLQSWKGSFLSYGGKLTLINSVLSSLPTYMLSFHHMPQKVKKNLDQIRANFLWNSGNTKKIHLANWEGICRPKQQGGLGILNLRHFNMALLCKWMWRFKDPSCKGWWKDMLNFKYSKCRNSQRWSPFWKSLKNLEQIVDINRHMRIGDGKSTLFWTDKWHKGLPLSSAYPSLFEICVDEKITVASVFQNNFANLQFRRQFSFTQYRDFMFLIQDLSALYSLSPAPDIVLWQGKKKGTYSTAEMYQWLDYRGIQENFYGHIWNLPIPLKIQVFLWLLSKRKLLTRHNLNRKGWDGPIECVYCDQRETIDHLFFKCSHIQPIWVWILQKIGVGVIPRNLRSYVNIMSSLTYENLLAIRVISAAIFWICWLSRNEVCFNSGLPISIRCFGMKMHAILSYWSGSWTQQLKNAVLQLVQVDELPFAIDGTHT